ncbi:MAG: acyloxyacyl hydrolase [Acidovorax sp.]
MAATSSSFLRRSAAIALLLVANAAHADPDRSPGMYAEGGVAPHRHGSTRSLTLGALVPWAPTESWRTGPWAFYWDLFASDWSAPWQAGGRRHYTQLGAVATFRYRFGEGRSPWFAEAGVGGTVMDRVYHSATRHFSTAFQFTEALGLGYSFGARREHELSLRLQHVSNAGIKEPNPGESFVRVRYAYRF